MATDRDATPRHDEKPPRELPTTPADPSPHAIDIESLLSEAESPAAEPSAAPADDAPAPLVGTDLDDVFGQLRGEAGRRAAVDAAEKAYRRALELQGAGEIDKCIEALQAASIAPKLRFVTASRLGRIFRDRGLMPQAIEWMELAAQAPAPSPAESHELLFDLADVLEATGEIARALAVCLELQADAGSYRDVDGRIERLAGAQGRG